MQLAIDKSIKAARSLQQYEGSLADERARDAISVDLGDLFANLTLLMDKAMNLIFDRVGDKDGNKPHIYFPDHDSEEMLFARLKKDKLSAVVEIAPLYRLIADVQTFAAGEDSWWPILRKLSAKRHEEFPAVTPSQSNGIGIGHGTFVAIENLSIVNGRIANLKGFEVDGETGESRPVSVKFYDEVRSTVGGFDLDPLSFATLCASEVGRLVKAIGAQLGR